MEDTTVAQSILIKILDIIAETNLRIKSVESNLRQIQDHINTVEGEY